MSEEIEYPGAIDYLILEKERDDLRAELEACKAKLSECIYNCCEAKQKKIDHLRVVEAELRSFKEKHGV